MGLERGREKKKRAGEEPNNLWLEVRSELRRYLDGVVAALRVAVLHVSVAFVAHAGARVVQIGTCTG